MWHTRPRVCSSGDRGTKLRFVIRFLFVLGVASLGFGILAFHLIPYWIILPSMPAAQRAAVDRSIFEMQWTDRGLYGLGVGTGLCLAALVLYLISKPRMPKAK